MWLKQKNIKATTSRMNCKLIWIVPAVLTTDNQNTNADDDSSCMHETNDKVDEEKREQMQSCPDQPSCKAELLTLSVLECHRFK